MLYNQNKERIFGETPQHMNKKEIEKKLEELNQEALAVKLQKGTELTAEINEKAGPLRKKLEEIEAEIYKGNALKYAKQIARITEEGNRLNSLLEQLNIEEAKGVWYPEGTLVYLWDYVGHRNSRNRQFMRTEKTGVVTVYDGTQVLAQTQGRYSYKIQKGDIIVVHNKKDGKPGVKFDYISKYGSLNMFNCKQWFAEGETPKDNILTRKKAKADENL